MIKFTRYPHINDLLRYYAEQEDRNEIVTLLKKVFETTSTPENLSRFDWRVAELVNEDEEQGEEGFRFLSFSNKACS